MGKIAAGGVVGRAKRTKLWKQEEETAAKVREWKAARRPRGLVRKPGPQMQKPWETKSWSEVVLISLVPSSSQINVEAGPALFHAVDSRPQVLAIWVPKGTVHSFAQEGTRSRPLRTEGCGWNSRVLLSFSFLKCPFTATSFLPTGKEGFLQTWSLLSGSPKGRWMWTCPMVGYIWVTDAYILSQMGDRVACAGFWWHVHFQTTFTSQCKRNHWILHYSIYLLCIRGLHTSGMNEQWI